MSDQVPPPPGWEPARESEMSQGESSQPTRLERLGHGVLVVVQGTTIAAGGLIILGLVINAVLPHKPLVKVKPFPDNLPAQLKQVREATLNVRYGESAGSGVKVGTNVAYTAEHVLVQPSNRPVYCTTARTT